MERGDNVLARSSLVIAFLSGCAGFVLLFGAARLMGYFEMPGAPKEHESVGAAIVCALAIFCFFEAYRFYRFFASPEIRDRYYARRRQNELKKS